MANAKSLAGLMKWLGRAEWRDAFNALLDRHLAPACTQAGISIDKLPELLGEHHGGVVWGCVFEDFLARGLDDGRNIVDDYLKRRGWNESASNKAYMRALRSSVMSLYEISDIVREESFLAREGMDGLCTFEDYTLALALGSSRSARFQSRRDRLGEFSNTARRPPTRPEAA